MNNKVFIAMVVRNAAVLDGLRMDVEGYHMFDRHGDARLVDKYSHFGFSSVVPEVDGDKVRWFWHMLGCSYVYFPCGWHEDVMSRKCFAPEQEDNLRGGRQMQVKVMFMTDIVKDRVWFFHAFPSLTVAHYGKYHQVRCGDWIRIILQFLLWHIEVQIDKNTQGNGNKELD